MSENEQTQQMRALACMLHSTYFGVLNALRKEMGLFAICELSVRSINEMLNAYFHLLEGQSISEILEHLESTGIYRELKLKKVGDSYIFDIGYCLFAGGNEGVHNSIKNIDMPCPIALFIGTCLTKENPSKKIYIYPSEYSEDGVITQMDLLSPQEYEKRIFDLKKLAKVD